MILQSCKDNSNASSGETEKSQTEETATTETDSTSKTILFFGDSLTAGYGLEDADNAFPGLIQDRIDSLGLDYTVINAGLSGETTAGGRNRLEWVLEPDVDIFVLELGANDGLRGVQVAETRENLQWMIDQVKTEAPEAKIVLVGMQLPPNLGTEYTRHFKKLFPELAEKNNITLVPFLLQNVGGVARLNQNDGIHPTAEGHKLVAENVWPVLEPLLNE
ncbi:acyl-CoA thioesterase-1 [Leeuwenhoekiella aestuarii]|uniref:Acyl-CoA thioesterase-1 n=2 Tax=Leeuwenhoekiella aestuarii TaxID=2249426 RepID=A0A4Q0NUS4_9FLAO|nr:arylesterase [Leeuwenhoekiella aestuarii]RXG15471.1 acyl-CoA thioesterase-1 [Leeuwenhoekiella aestuarii]RXG17422.1 acyl-CoA thioesterase-1 [Leeuwenhoekiella aestuarii]